MTTPRFISILAGLTLMAAGTAVAQHAHEHSAGEHGKVAFEVSCAEGTHDQFNRAVALLHHMMYEQSESIFREVAAEDPECAMAYWGIAMTQLHPLWAPPTEQELQKGREAVEKAQSLGAPTPREQAYVEAIAAFFATEGSFGERLQAWHPAQKKVFEENPDDVDAGAFHALSMLATSDPSDKSFMRQKEAGTLLGELLAKSPEHPGLFHYSIHAYDNPAFASEASTVAEGYDKLAPEVPHALHMPSHIFVRLGMWKQVADWNRRSADAALKHPSGGMTSMHHAHAVDYLVYAYLQLGKDEEARAALAELSDTYQGHIGSAYALAAAPARVALERRAWEEAAELPVRHSDAVPWDNFPAAEAITYFARGIGSARLGRVDDARAAAEALEKLEEKLTGADRYWSTQVKAQRKAVSAWIAYAEGDREEAIELMRAAADVEDSVDKHPVTPSAPLPARELLGEMLLLENRPEEALAAFQASLQVSQNRLNSLSGAGRAAELSGNRELAREFYESVLQLVSASDVERPRVSEARTFIAEM